MNLNNSKESKKSEFEPAKIELILFNSDDMIITDIIMSSSLIKLPGDSLTDT